MILGDTGFDPTARRPPTWLFFVSWHHPINLCGAPHRRRSPTPTYVANASLLNKLIKEAAEVMR